jgi:hypothetical protein
VAQALEGLAHDLSVVFLVVNDEEVGFGDLGVWHVEGGNLPRRRDDAKAAAKGRRRGVSRSTISRQF